MDFPNWVSNYVGIPYCDRGRTRKAIDCYGLLRLVYQEQFNLELLSMTDTYETSNNASETIKNNGLDSDKWIRIRAPIAGSVIVINMAGEPRHVGIMITRKHMLHSLKGHNSAIEKVTTTKWKNRIEGYYIYV